MGGFAWVTLATNDSYSLGALVLAHSIKQAGSHHQLVVLVTPGVTNSMREKLSSVFNLIQEVNILDSKDETNLRLLKRPELGVTFTKLHCWRLTQFDKCVFLDADTLVLKNCDELFEREELSAAPDVGWPDCFNSGVFVYRPSTETYEKLVQFALEKGSFDGGDQGLLNLYFSDWATKDISKHLPFIYNLCSTACYSYLPAFKQFGTDTKIIHFIGSAKPWLQYFNTETRKVQPSPDFRHLEGILQHWWNIFCSLVHSQLTSTMARSTSDVTHTSRSFCTSQNHDPPHRPSPTENIIWDPWEEYDQNQSNVPSPEPFTHPEVSSFQDKENSSYQTQPSSNSEPSELKPIQSHNTNAYDASYEHVPSFSNDQPEEISVDLSYENNPSSNSFQGENLTSVPLRSPPASIIHIPQNSSQDSQHYCELVICTPKPIAPIPYVQTNESEAAATVCKETTLHSAPCEDQNDSGLAGAFAKLTLGAPRTAEQTALDDHLRRQGWEVGNIDYMGRDSFDNIWSKICQTIAPEVPPPSKTTEATTPSSTSEPQAEKSVPQEALPSPAVAAPQDSTSQTSEIIKLQSEPTQSIPSQQSKPVSEIESPVQASPEAPKEIKPEAPIVSEIVPTTEIPAVPAAQAEPLLCSLPSKLPQESVPVESPQAPIASKTEVASEKPSEIPPVVPTATPELPLAAAPPTGSSTSTKDVVATTPTDVVPAPSAPVASTIAESPAPEQICVIPSKGSETSAPAPQAESAPETPQTSPPPAEGTKSTPAQIQSLPEVPPPAEVQKPCERTSVEILLPEPTVIEPIPVKDIEKPIEVAPVVSAPKVESPSAPPSQEIPKTSTPDPVPSPLPTQQPTPVQGVAKVPEPAPTKVVPEPVPVPATTEAAAATPEESAPVKEAAPAAAVACTKEEASAAAPEAAAAEACKAKPAAKPKAESAGAGAQPTPPPRKTGGGGGKKSKSKK